MAVENIIVGVILLVIGGIVLAYAIKYLMDKQKTDEWLETQAIIVNSASKKKSDDSESWIETEIVYTYEINGNSYTNSGFKHDTGAKKRDMKKLYAKGNPLLIYYNPQNPSVSKFEKGVDILLLLRIHISRV